MIELCGYGGVRAADVPFYIGSIIETFGTAKTPWFGYAADIVEIEVTEGVTVGTDAFKKTGVTL